MDFDVCLPRADDVFGPRVDGCRQGFDFTLLFEQAILSAVPSLLFIAVSIFCLPRLLHQSRKTVSHSRYPLKASKQILILSFAVIQLSLIVLWLNPASHPTRVSLPSSILSLIVGLLLAILSYLCHDRSERPSTLINVYLPFAIVFDICQARTLWLRNNTTIAAVFTAALIFRGCILFLEIIEKRWTLREPYCDSPPEALAGTINRNIFWWINALLYKGYSVVLALSDLFDIDDDLSTERLGPIFQQRWAATDKKRRYSLVRVTLRCLWKPFLKIVIPRFLLSGFKICQPLLTYRTLSLLSEPNSPSKTNIGRALIGASALIYVGIALTTARYKHCMYRFITMTRGGLVSLIYHSTLNVDASAAGNSAAVTLMSTDIERIASGLEIADYLWAGPVEIGVSLYLLYRQIGAAFASPIVLVLICVGFPFATSGLSAAAQKAWNEAVEKRVSATASRLGHIKGVKMAGLSDTLGGQLHNFRVKELQISLAFRKIFGLTMICSNTSTILLPVVTLLVHVLVTRANGVDLDPSLAFTSISLISLASDPTRQMAKAVTRVAATLACFQRIQDYITNSSLHGDHDETSLLRSVDQDVELKGFSTHVHSDSQLRLESVDFAFQPGMDPVLHDINLKIEPGTWTVVTGPIGSGKSALLHGLLNELYTAKGSFHRPSALQIGYCAQNPWLPRMSLRQIIVGCSEFDADWYLAILTACALVRDVRQLSQGDSTIIGGQGSSLSGGQRQRLSLARALYSKKTLLLLDDVLSGLDASTEQTIVDNVFGPSGICRHNGTTVVLVTHAVHQAQGADNVIVMASDGRVAKQGPPPAIDLRPNVDCDYKSMEEPTTLASYPREEIIDLPRPESEGELKKDEPSPLRQAGDIQLYGYYIQTLGWAVTVGILICQLLTAFLCRSPTLVVDWWSNAEDESPGAYTDMYMGVFGSLSALYVIFAAASVYLLLFVGTPRSSITLHWTLLQSVMEAPYWFFVSNDSGLILNRFSQDMSLVDMELPLSVLDTLFSVGMCLMEAGLIAAASKWLALMCPALVLVLYVIQKFYLQTSRQIRLLDLETKTPLYSHFLETLQGLTTIRAFQWQHASIEEHQGLLNDSQRPFYLMYTIQRWLNFVLDMMVAVLATMIVTLATQLSGSAAGAIGVGLSTVLSFSQDLSSLIRAWTELETSLGAIARVRDFEMDTPSEHRSTESLDPPVEWPLRGSIQVQDLCVSYKTDSDLVLKDLCLDIQPGQKVGICGRTGSGKSSLILALLRLVEIEHGEIFIDGVPLSVTPRNSIRRAITTVAQEPLILAGTVRFNADPFEEHSDKSIISALQAVGIWDLIYARGGLDEEINGKPLSLGQKQLFCLARAILSPSPIVILDEVTANVDAATEETMMAVIEEKFTDKTVLAVAHHLHTIRHFDRVAVLNHGCLEEWGSPDELLGQPTIFRELWDIQQ
ncbi:hypothetical protein MW887_005747 [Aspergillus wentii]|nr:hypothetical protein MW887_005747 [Aspergillus wentii]